MATPNPRPNPRTTDRLRHDLDHGRGGDKKGFPDPAAAPLGTDAEAAGTPPAPRERDMAYRAEIANRPDGPTASEAQRPVTTDHADHTDHADAGSAADRTESDAHGPDAAGPSVLIFIGIIAAVMAVILAAWLL